MNSKTLIKILLWLTAMVLLRVYSGPLVFAPTPGTTLERELTHSSQFELVEMDLVYNGFDVMEYWLHGFQLTSEHSQSVLVQDTYHSIAEGRPQALERTFENLAQTFEITVALSESAQPFTEGDGILTSSDLEHSTVEFRWDGEDYDTPFQHSPRQRDDRLLEGLVENMDLRLLLPDGDAEVGDTWEFDIADLPDLLSPGGYFAWGDDTESAAKPFTSMINPVLAGELREVLGGLLQGETSVTYASETADVSLLEFTVDVSGHNKTDDLKQLAETILDDMGDLYSTHIESLHLDVTLRASGTAHWDSARGHLSDAACEGIVESTLEMVLILNERSSSEARVELRTVVRGTFKEQMSVR